MVSTGLVRMLEIIVSTCIAYPKALFSIVTKLLKMPNLTLKKR